MSGFSFLLGLASVGTAGILVYCLVVAFIQNSNKKKLRKTILDSEDNRAVLDGSHTADDQCQKHMRHLEELTRQLFCGTTQPLARSAHSKRASKTLMGTWFDKHATWAGCAHSVSPAAFCEASLRAGLIGCVAGCVIGLTFSVQLAVLLAIGGFLFGYSLPLRTIRRAIRERTTEAELHLSEMLQIVSLGLRSGLTFDRSFALYGIYFDNGFSRSCTQTYRRWALGLSTREESLKEFSASYKCEQLSHVIDSVLRSLRFGSSLAPTLEEASAQARASYRACLEERVAKAPVKMMLPTGTLILPAMLLLILGPVLLELIQGI